MWIIVSSACSTPPLPPEVSLSATQEDDLWRSGAAVYAPDDFLVYQDSLRKAKDRLIFEQARFLWFRDYERVRQEFSSVLFLGDSLHRKVLENKTLKAEHISRELSYLENRAETLKKLSRLINEGRMARKDITIMEVLLGEARLLAGKEAFDPAEEKLALASSHSERAIKVILPILNRYVDDDQVKKWRTWIDETIRVSREKGSYAIVVSKIDRTLVLYRSGKAVKTYAAGVGINGSRDKHYAGDRATPEGMYHIIKKLPKSKFHKALLIDYPNADDRRQFAAKKKKGLIPAGAGIGGLIEIHGGGSRSMTYGCVALENTMIDELFSVVEVGTPVTIVGAADFQNNIAVTMKEL